MKKNDIITLNITDFSTEGHGIGRADCGMTVFVPGSAVGDVVSVLVVKVLKKYCFGKVLEVLSPSAHRTAPLCPVFSRCGGCCFCHINYDCEKQVKQKRICDALLRIGGIKADVLPLIGADEVYRYRNKGQYPLAMDGGGRVVAGFYALNSHRVVPCADCLLQPSEFAGIIEICLDFFNKNAISVYNQTTGEGLLRNLYLRKSDYNNKICVCVVVNGESLRNSDVLVERLKNTSGVSGVILNINRAKNNVVLGERCVTLYGKQHITDTLLGLRFNIAPTAFFQVNKRMTEQLYLVAAEFAQAENSTILDLFCGAGTIGLSLAKSAKRVIGVDVVHSAIENAKQNAVQNAITNADFICGTAARAAESLAADGIKPDVVILDPPRKGVTPELVATICNGFSPKRVVYVSCDSATLARDLKIFAERGYNTTKIQGVDMFPRTAHVETVALLQRQNI